MGWATGSSLFEEIIKAMQKEVPDENVMERVYGKIIKAFFHEDWDTEYECRGKDPAYDKALDKCLE